MFYQLLSSIYKKNQQKKLGKKSLLMFIDVEFWQLMPCFLVSHKPARQSSGS